MKNKHKPLWKDERTLKSGQVIKYVVYKDVKTHLPKYSKKTMVGYYFENSFWSYVRAEAEVHSGYSVLCSFEVSGIIYGIRPDEPSIGYYDLDYVYKQVKKKAKKILRNQLDTNFE